MRPGRFDFLDAYILTDSNSSRGRGGASNSRSAASNASTQHSGWIWSHSESPARREINLTPTLDLVYDGAAYSEYARQQAPGG